jgi:hypothetical protein
MQIDTTIEKKPSLLRQIVDEVDTLDETAKEDILRKIKMKKAIEATKKLEEKLQNSWDKNITEEEIADFISEERNKNYLENPDKFKVAK